jgi:hypothetical protein
MEDFPQTSDFRLLRDANIRHRAISHAQKDTNTGKPACQNLAIHI